MALTCNVGGVDKGLRVAGGVGPLAFAGLSNADARWRAASGSVAAIALVTALAGYCPLNSLLGINTCRQVP